MAEEESRDGVGSGGRGDAEEEEEKQRRKRRRRRWDVKRLGGLAIFEPEFGL